jgi:hypothetical protein
MPGAIGVQLPGVNLLAPTVSTEVLCLLNMVTEEELRDDEEYEGIDLIIYALFFLYKILVFFV